MINSAPCEWIWNFRKKPLKTDKTHFSKRNLSFGSLQTNIFNVWKVIHYHFSLIHSTAGFKKKKVLPLELLCDNENLNLLFMFAALLQFLDTDISQGLSKSEHNFQLFRQNPCMLSLFTRTSGWEALHLLVKGISELSKKCRLYKQGEGKIWKHFVVKNLFYVSSLSPPQNLLLLKFGSMV